MFLKEHFGPDFVYELVQLGRMIRRAPSFPGRTLARNCARPHRSAFRAKCSCRNILARVSVYRRDSRPALLSVTCYVLTTFWRINVHYCNLQWTVRLLHSTFGLVLITDVRGCFEASHSGRIYSRLRRLRHHLFPTSTSMEGDSRHSKQTLSLI